MAFYTDKTPGHLLQYSVSVLELGTNANGMTPKEHLTAFKLAFQKDELSRKEIEHGSKKLPGLDIVIRRAGILRRTWAIVSGTRMYEVGVTAATEEALGGVEVKKFFDSFGVDE